MKKSVLVIVAALMLGVCAYAESAHKGWSADISETSTYPALRSVTMRGPWTRIDKPDPSTNAPFRCEYAFQTHHTVVVQKVYMLLAQEDGTLQTREIKAVAPTLPNEQFTRGVYGGSFTTEEVAFKEGDAFMVVFKIDGKTTPVFLSLRYHPFVPS
jgi:hypothetical protein